MSSKTGKIVALSIVGVLVVLILVVIIGAWAMFGTFIKAGKTIKKIDNGFYSMEFSRGFYKPESKTMVVHTFPDNGYESISTCNLDFIGFGDDFTPDGSMEERMESLAAIYVPLDGMNVKGLIVADLVVGENGDTEETHQHTGKTPVTTTTALRMMLDKCKNVDEAIELLKEYDMNSDIGANHHYAIVDANGKSVVVEYRIFSA